MCPQLLEASLKPRINVKKKKEVIQGPKRTQHHWFRPQEDNKSNTMNG